MIHGTITLKRAIVIYVSLTLTLTFYHTANINRPFWLLRSEFHQGIIQGDFKSPYQYRIIAPIVAETGGRVLVKVFGLPEGKPAVAARELFYVLQSFIATLLLFIFFDMYLRTWFSSELAFAGTLILAGLHLYTYQHYFYQPDSPLNIMLLTLGAYLMRRGKFKGWLYPLTILGSFNRETFVLIVLLHLATFGLNKETLKHTGGLFLTWLVVQVILRIMFGIRPPFPSRPFVENLYAIGWPLFLFSLMWIIPIIYFRQLPLFLRRALLLFAPPLILANFVFGKVEETRLFLDLAIVIIPSVLFVLVKVGQGDVDPLVLDVK